MPQPSTTTPSLRERTREAVRDEIRQSAIELFAAQGFDETRTEEIAAAAGISARSFFRYFATKEDVLVSGAIAIGEQIRDRFAARPSEEDVWTSLRRALDVAVEPMERLGEQAYTGMTVIMSTAQLRAAHLEKHLAWEELLVPEISDRLGTGSPDIAARTLAHTAMACLDVALFEWVRTNQKAPLSRLLDETFEVRLTTTSR